MKKCKVCNKEHAFSHFAPNKLCKDGRINVCRDCWADYRLYNRYGLTKEKNQQLYISQEGKCGICDTFHLRRDLVVDHNHTTGEVRGLLCRTCNRGIGLLKDDIVVLKNAIKYLIKNNPDQGKNDN